MMKAYWSLSRDKSWTANDLNCKRIIKASPRFRKRMRRAVRRRQKQSFRKEVTNYIA